MVAGNIKQYEAIIHLSQNSKPINWKPRPEPFAIKDKIEQDLDRLLSAGIIEKLDTLKDQIKWASPSVSFVKPNGSIRNRADFKVSINKYIEAHLDCIPRFEEILNKLCGGILLGH
ncbi:hypothetical protein RF11_05605 [Thelohanellus kitauei]|uniref:Uncharacterized protein n=1 Tax=Thelohanellus kitauei TaxID=669202 RepID=A0A0C2MFP4_THEKT|nr:hypothetical protein RF11_05605 [Thelohanellus kitauei]